jgi:hypothetical protein
MFMREQGAGLPEDRQATTFKSSKVYENDHEKKSEVSRQTNLSNISIFVKSFGIILQ